MTVPLCCIIYVWESNEIFCSNRVSLDPQVLLAHQAALEILERG